MNLIGHDYVSSVLKGYVLCNIACLDRFKIWPYAFPLLQALFTEMLGMRNVCMGHAISNSPSLATSFGLDVKIYIVLRLLQVTTSAPSATANQGYPILRTISFIARLTASPGSSLRLSLISGYRFTNHKTSSSKKRWRQGLEPRIWHRL